MRAIVLDELNKLEIQSIKDYLETRTDNSGLNDLYWLTIKNDFLQGADEHYMAIEVGSDWVRFELLRRNSSHIKDNDGFFEGKQAIEILAWIETMSKELSLKTC